MRPAVEPGHHTWVSNFVSEGVPLTSVVGLLDDHREAALRSRLLVIDEELRHLAADATSHVGSDFAHWSLRLFETVREICGGAAANVGDIWFEMWNPDPQRWEVSASIPVHCDLMPPGYSCLHDLYDEHRQAGSPEEAVELLADLVADVRARLPYLPAAWFHQFPHSDFPDA